MGKTSKSWFQQFQRGKNTHLEWFQKKMILQWHLLESDFVWKRSIKWANLSEVKNFFWNLEFLKKKFLFARNFFPFNPPKNNFPYSESEEPGLLPEKKSSKSKWGHFVFCPLECFWKLEQVCSIKFLKISKTNIFLKNVWKIRNLGEIQAYLVQKWQFYSHF